MLQKKNRLQFQTLGCSKNKVDTEHILSQVTDMYDIIPEGEDVKVDVSVNEWVTGTNQEIEVK